MDTPPGRVAARVQTPPVDWYLEGDDRAALRSLRHTVAAYLERHASPGQELSDASLVLEELVGNAARHAGGPIWVSLNWAQMQPIVTVRDLGPGFDPALLERAARAPLGLLDSLHVDPSASMGDGPFLPPSDDALEAVAEGGRGLFLVTHLAGSLHAQARRGNGMVVTATLDVKRSPAVSHDPPRRVADALPSLTEAQPGGGFGKESFLRALVVQLARTLEFSHGPDAAEAAVAQVGADVGGQMEEEFRLARGITARMTVEEMAECLVRLKHAIDGGFYVQEISEAKLVLGNRQCPFGDAVRLAPALCRMTSSVFGGIAARNSDEGASVVLEERIAVGDDGCRVIIHLRPPSDGEQLVSHRYAAPVDRT